jgi:hypothetical protein
MLAYVLLALRSAPVAAAARLDARLPD